MEGGLLKLSSKTLLLCVSIKYTSSIGLEKFLTASPSLQQFRIPSDCWREGTRMGPKWWPQKHMVTRLFEEALHNQVVLVYRQIYRMSRIFRNLLLSDNSLTHAVKNCRTQRASGYNLLSTVNIYPLIAW